MKILIDKQLPTKLRFRFTEAGVDTFTIRDRSWLGIKNGELLKYLVNYGFDVLITNHKHMYDQQHINCEKFSILTINSKINRYPDILEAFAVITNELKVIESNLLLKKFSYQLTTTHL
jgi:predicted nuclease of predicted toxin-antitoxin system